MLRITCVFIASLYSSIIMLIIIKNIETFTNSAIHSELLLQILSNELVKLLYIWKYKGANHI